MPKASFQLLAPSRNGVCSLQHEVGVTCHRRCVSGCGFGGKWLEVRFQWQLIVATHCHECHCACHLLPCAFLRDSKLQSSQV